MPVLVWCCGRASRAVAQTSALTIATGSVSSGPASVVRAWCIGKAYRGRKLRTRSECKPVHTVPAPANRLLTAAEGRCVANRLSTVLPC